jgi:hypothetical protein
MSKRSVINPSNFPLFGGAPAALLALIGLVSGCASTNQPMPPAVPPALQPPASVVLMLRARAVGVQIYQCQANKDDPSRFDWVFKAPEAQLFDKGGKPIIKHYAGPTWEASDGSAVVGEVVAKDDGPDPLAIPWLLLHVKSNSGKGILSRTQNVQRLNTVGGKAPQGGCGALLVGSEARVHYVADYLFYGPRS